MGGFRMRLVETKLDQKGYDELMDHIDSLEQAAKYGIDFEEKFRNLQIKLSKSRIHLHRECLDTDEPLNVYHKSDMDTAGIETESIIITPVDHDQ